jgi:AraC-like DNA-binding protein
MNDEDRQVFASRQHPIIGVAILCDVLRELDIDPGPVLTESGIDPAIVSDPGATVKASQELAFIRRSGLVSNIGDLGLRAGRRHHFTLFGMWGFALAASPTLDDAIRIGLRYIDLTHTFLRWTYVPLPQEPRIELLEAGRLGAARRFVIDRDMSACVTLLQDLTGNRQAIQGADFPFQAPGDHERYESVFGSGVRFGTARAALHIDASRLQVPLPQANALAASLAEEQCRRQLEGRGAGSGTAGRVRSLLLDRTNGLQALPEVAAAFSVSVRTLRRRLDAEGTSYRKVLDQVRQDLALQYLDNTSLRIDEIASRLGYGEAAGFCHAFRRWRGESPGRWRRREN